MRLRQLHLDRFGHFTDHTFDFDKAKGSSDFHIIHGRNESGKTTAKEAVLRLFYGFPTREPYAFKHQRPNLRVSALLELNDGSRRFTRLPKRIGALLDENGTPVPETALTVHLGGLVEEDYRKLLCLDDDTIERGGEEIAQAKGDIGRLLFSAAAGVADLSTVLDRVRDEADELWRKRASKTHIAGLKREITEVEREIRARDVSANAWRALKEAVSAAQDHETAARRARDELKRTMVQVEVKRRSLPLLADVDRLDGKIAPYTKYPKRLNFEPLRLDDLLKSDARARADVEHVTAQIDGLKEALVGIQREPELLSLLDWLDDLEELRSRDATARLDLDRRRLAAAEHKAEMASATKDMEAVEGTDPNDLVLSAAGIGEIESACTTLRDAERAVEIENTEIATLKEQLATLRVEHRLLAEKTSPGKGIGEILAQHDAEQLATVHARARQMIEAAEASHRCALEALSRGSTSFDALPVSSMTPAQARALFNDHEALANRIANDEEKLAQHKVMLAANKAQADHLLRSVPVTSDHEANELQRRRDRSWAEHRGALTEESADAFEVAMREVDVVMQRRLTHAQDLGQLRQIERAQAETASYVEETAKRLNDLRDRKKTMAAQVDASASQIGLPVPMPPADWSDWVAAHEAANEAQRSLVRTRAAHRADLERADRLLEALRPLVELDDPEFDAALSRARDIARAVQEQADAVQRAKGKFDRDEAELNRRKARLKRLQASVMKSEHEFVEIVTDRLRGSVLPSALRTSIEPLRKLREASIRLADIMQRIKTMEADQARFAEEMAKLAATHAVTESRDPVDIFAGLRLRAKAAQESEKEFERLVGLIERAECELTEGKKRLDDIRLEVSALSRIFPPGTVVDTIEDLRQATAIAVEVIENRTARARCEAELLRELSMPDLDATRVLFAGIDAATLDAKAECLAVDFDSAEAALTKAIEARVTAERDLSQVTGDVGVAMLNERKVMLELQLEDAAVDHLELHLGHQMAERAIRRYRDTHRSSMMSATERSFATLTRGAYSRLDSQQERDGETLLAFDAGNTAKRVSEMSKGTRFQLYLALRAAAHEQLVAQGVCLPFFCDDIFETFDEERTSAACRMMERIGGSGQAIYFTHHRHVVDIALAECDTAPVVHEL